MNIFKKIKKWFADREAKREREFYEYVHSHSIPLEIGKTVSCDKNGVVYVNGQPHNGNGYVNGRAVSAEQEGEGK